MKQKYKSALEILTSAPTLGHAAQREIPVQFTELIDSFIRILLVSSHYSHPPQSINDAVAINGLISTAPFYRQIGIGEEGTVTSPRTEAADRKALAHFSSLYPHQRSLPQSTSVCFQKRVHFHGAQSQQSKSEHPPNHHKQHSV